jgi:hypothetical protein
MLRSFASASRWPLPLLITPSLLLLLSPLLCMLLLQESRCTSLELVLPVVLAPKDSDGRAFWV